MFKKLLQPLSEGEKSILVLSFLEEKGETAFQEGSLSPEEINNLLLSTSHYTLINFLEFFYLYRRNADFARNINELAHGLGISLRGLPLSPTFLIRLGFTFISTRANLDEDDKKIIADNWVKSFTDTDKPFDSEKAACESWVGNIVRTVQSYELIHQTGQELDGEYAGQVFDNLLDNRELVKKYLTYRKL